MMTPVLVLSFEIHGKMCSRQVSLREAPKTYPNSGFRSCPNISMSSKSDPLHSNVASPITRMSTKLCRKFPHGRLGSSTSLNFSFNRTISIFPSHEYREYRAYPITYFKSKCRGPVNRGTNINS